MNDRKGYQKEALDCGTAKEILMVEHRQDRWDGEQLMADFLQRLSGHKATHSFVLLLLHLSVLLLLLGSREEDQEKRTEQTQILQMRPSLRQNLSDRPSA